MPKTVYQHNTTHYNTTHTQSPEKKHIYSTLTAADSPSTNSVYQKILITLLNRYFGTKPTTISSEESNVRIAESAMPWKADHEGKVYKYQYHPHGDKSQPLRNAPSAMNTVIVPDVTLPEVYISSASIFSCYHAIEPEICGHWLSICTPD